MNKIQKSLTAVLALVLSLTFAYAQGPGPRGGGYADRTPEEIAEQQTTRMTQQLALTEEQVAKVKELNLAFAQKMKENRDQTAADREAAREAMTANREAHGEALKNVLTEEQFQKWENAMGQRGPRPGPGAKDGKFQGKKRGGKKSRN